MCFFDDPHKILDYLLTFYTLKSVSYPQFYLGGDVLQLPYTWDQQYNLYASTYIKNCFGALESMC